MKPIFQYCEGWEICEHEDLWNLFERKKIRGDEFELPDEYALNRLNEKCRECRRELRIEKEECPICGNKNLGALRRFFRTGPAVVTIEGFYYRCDQCNRGLISYGKLD